MKKKIIAGILAFAVAITGIPGTSVFSPALVQADETETEEAMPYTIDGYLADKDGFKELAVGDLVCGYANFTANDGSDMVYGEQWDFVDDVALEEQNISYLYYSAYDNAADAQQDKVDFIGEIPEAAFGKYVYKRIFVYTIPEQKTYTCTLRSDSPINAWVGQDTVALSEDKKTVYVYSIWGDDRTEASFAKTTKIGGKSYKITAIGNYACETTSLKKVTLHSGITSVGKKAFRGASKLKTIIINGDLKQVGEGAFADVNPKATFKIKASKAKYDKIVKRIKKSGVPKTVKFKRVK